MYNVYGKVANNWIETIVTIKDYQKEDTFEDISVHQASTPDDMYLIDSAGKIIICLNKKEISNAIEILNFALTKK